MKASKFDDVVAEHLMEQHPICAGPDTRLREVWRLLQGYQIRHMPVVENKRLVGILSEGDLREALGLALDAGARERLDWPCSRIYCEHVITCEKRTPLCVLLNLLLEHKVGALPVVEGGELAGIVSYIDVLRVVRDGMVRGKA